MAKDPKRQLLGKIARQKGQYFEQRLDGSFDYYRDRGYAVIEKTPEPMKVIKPEGSGRFLACYTKKAQVDYKGTLKGGRTILIEAKFTSTDRLTQDRVWIFSRPTWTGTSSSALAASSLPVSQPVRSTRFLGMTGGA